MNKAIVHWFVAALLLHSAAAKAVGPLSPEQESRLTELIQTMTLAEKIGQLSQRNAPGGVPDDLRSALASGAIGSLLNEVDPQTVNAIQRIAVEESRLGIPLLMARDVIHGYRTIFPIPLGLAATFNPDLVREGARVAALEAASQGINWTFAPMIDVTRDPRWGRVAESFGEDWYLTSIMGTAMVQGFQGENLGAHGSIAACAKHFAGYGASEAGRDYNTTNIPEHELRNVYLRPFQATVDAGVATLMTSFSDLNGVPASGNDFLLRQILRDEWAFEGFVVSDWASIEQLVDHGLAADAKDAARQALLAGVNMEMVTTTYADHISDLVESGALPVATLDKLVEEVLRVKLALGLFENPYTDTDAFPALGNEEHLTKARDAALQSLVLLHNDNATLPIATGSTIAVVGPLADAPHEQMGTWVFDGREGMSVTPRMALEQALPDHQLIFEQALVTSRAAPTDAFETAIEAARQADIVVLFLGEESILSGEAHSRADIGLPGSQDALLEAMDATGKPVVTVILAGRPLTLDKVLAHSDAVLYAWHPGTMGGTAIADILLGKQSPSGRLPITFPRMVGQVPIYYAQKNTGKPATPKTFTALEDLPVKAFQAAFGMTSHHLDAGYTPLYPFGYGLTYTEFEYRDLELSSNDLTGDSPLIVSARIMNTGAVTATETVQLYVRDLVGSVTRPIRELKGFQRVSLKAGESRRVQFNLTVEDLDFYDRRMQRVTEPGDFHVWIGPDSSSGLQGAFTIPSELQTRLTP